MFFLIRAAFWLTVVVLLLPADPSTGEAPRVGAVQALTAVQATATDLSSFCDRNPDVCATGSAAFEIISEKFRAGARLVQNAFDAHAANPPTTVSAPSADTLTREDVSAPWHGVARRGSI
jgi:hypothetical protein